MYIHPITKQIMGLFSERETTYNYTIMVNAYTETIWELDEDTLHIGEYNFPMAHIQNQDPEYAMKFLARSFPYFDVFTLDSTRFFTEGEMQAILLPYTSHQRRFVAQMLKINGVNGVYEALVITDANWEQIKFEESYAKAQEKSSD
jgi:hypothetical protein